MKEIYEAYLQLMHQRDRALREGFGKYGEGYIRMTVTTTENRLKEAVKRLEKLKL